MLPKSICRLTKVKTLDISHTHLQALPKNFGNMASIETLNLFNCKLKELPVSIGNLERLTYINVYNNFDLNEGYRAYLRPSVKVDG